MKRLDQLKEIADETLAGLEAGPELRRRILAQQTAPARRTGTGLWIAVGASFAAACCVLALAVGMIISNMRGTRPAQDPILQVGNLGADSAANELASVDTDKATLTVTKKNASRAQGILGDGLIRIDGRYYRYLKGISVSEGSLVGSGLIVNENVSDITLSSVSVVSNAVPVGTEILHVRDMSATLVACRVDGSLQVYQRVSYNGVGRVGSERGLSDVLQLRSHVRAMSLSGVGIVEGGEAERLLGVLLDYGVFDGNSSVKANQVLIIELDNGAAVQLNVNGDRIGGCGVWACPDFFDQFQMQ